MRNLKKFLALVLAMVMAFSLMISANATSYDKFGDKEQIAEEFKEAVQVLNGLNVLKGDNNGDFRPEDPISRAEAAAIMYRIATGDVNDDQIGVYVDYTDFSDVNDGDWYAGYVSWCQDAGIIRGVGGNRFDPYRSVTGYEMLTMLLRAVGYGKENEFSGAAWKTTALKYAEQLHITDNVNATNYRGTLNAPAQRQIVADLVFQTLALVPTVNYNFNSIGYSDQATIGSVMKNPTLGQKIFGLYPNKTKGWYNAGAYGEPGYDWMMNAEPVGNQYDPITLLPVYDTTKATLCTTIMPTYNYEYHTGNIRECDVAHDMGIETSHTFRLYVNSKTVTAANYKIEAIDTVTPVGGQGRDTYFWKGVSSKYMDKLDSWCVMIDTYLAKVIGVTAPVLDKNDHVIVPAKLDLEVYDATMKVSDTVYPSGVGTNNLLTTTTTTGKFPSKHQLTKNSAWEYSVGDMLLVQGYTDKTQNYDNTGVSSYKPDGATEKTNKNQTGLNHDDTVYGTKVLEKCAYETNVLFASDTDAKITLKGDKKPLTPMIGTQSKTNLYVNKHTVDGADYDDQNTLFLDRAGTNSTVKWAWYFDGDNLIGIDEAPNTVQYGVITSLYAAFNQGETYTDGTTKAIATVLMADNTTQTIAIDRFLVSSLLTSTGAGGRNVINTSGIKLVDSTGAPVNTAASSLELIPMYDYNSGGDLMKMKNITGTTTARNAVNKANLMIAPIADINKQTESVWAAPGGSGGADYYGIILGNMFKFVNTAYGMTAVEVAGLKDAASRGATNTGAGEITHDDENTGIYEWLYHEKTDNTPGLNKTLGMLVVNNTITLWVDNNTKIMVRSNVNTDVVRAYNGLSELPGDVVMPINNEVDWVDFNGDGRVDYVYLTGTVSGNTTYGLVYYNEGKAFWSGAEGRGEAEVWKNGELTTLVFTDYNQYSTIVNHTSTVDAENYKAHLFAVQEINGVVNDVMVTGFANYSATPTSNKQGPYVLADSSTPDFNKRTTVDRSALSLADAKDGTGASTADGYADSIIASSNTSTTANPAVFGLGTKWGNPYDKDTRAIYIDDTKVGNTDPVTFNVGANKVTVATGQAGTATGNGDYYLSTSTKIFGIGRGVNNGLSVLYYLDECDANDVTIIYDVSSGSNVILEIYVATDPDWTPSGGNSGTGAAPAGTPGDDIGKVTAPTSGLVDADIKNKAPSVGKEGQAYTSAVGGSVLGTSNARDVLYIPFTMKTANKIVTLAVYPAGSSTAVYTEATQASDITDTNAHYFVFNFKSTTLNKGTLTGALTAGNYVYYVTDADGAMLTYGSFTMN